jgi:hypothetical protein
MSATPRVISAIGVPGPERSMLNRYHVLIAVEQAIDAVACTASVSLIASGATNLEIPQRDERCDRRHARMQKGRTEVPDFRQPERSPPVGFVNAVRSSARAARSCRSRSSPE